MEKSIFPLLALLSTIHIFITKIICLRQNQIQFKLYVNEFAKKKSAAYGRSSNLFEIAIYAIFSQLIIDAGVFLMQEFNIGL